MINYFKKNLKKIRLMINRFGCKRRSEKIVNKDLTLISNNCWAGIVYEHLGIKFNSPTIGLFIMPADYIEFCRKIRYYLQMELCFINTSDSKYYDFLIENNMKECIIGKLENVEIFFLHYENQKEVIEKWNRRKKRVNYRNIIFKFNDQNLCTYDDLKSFNELPIGKKLIFSSKDYKELDSNVFMKKYKRLPAIKEDYYSCYKYIDLIGFCNQ